MTETNEKFCQHCGKRISGDAVFCPYCGFKQTPEPTTTSEPTKNNDYAPVGTIKTKNADTNTDTSATNQATETSTFGGALKRYFSNLFDLNGRSSLGDFWWPQLLLFLVNLIVMTILTLVFFLPVLIHPDNFFYYDDDFTTALIVRIIGYIVIIGLIHLTEFFLNFSVTVRRLHDSGKSGLYLLLYFLFLIPYIGGLAASITLLVFTLLPSDSGPNRYGNPTHTTSLN